MGHYVEIQADEFIQFIEYKNGERTKWNEIRVPGVRERVWEFNINKTLKLRIYSSITDDLSRGRGKDAIRICIFAVHNKNDIFLSSKTVYRTQNALKNIEKKCLALAKEYINKKCKKCNLGYMREIKYKTSKFYGCTNYKYGGCTNKLYNVNK